MRTIWLAAGLGAATLAAGAGNGCGGQTRHAPSGPAQVIAALPGGSFQVGPYRLSEVYKFRKGTPSSLADLERVFGRADSCKLVNGDAVVRWPRAGVSGDFSTLGAFSDAAGHPVTDGTANGCNHRGQVQVGTLTVSAGAWRTREGLRLGDRLERLLSLYPRALQDGDSWWLHTSRSPYGGKDEVQDLTARIRGGRVLSFTVQIGAQGE